MKFKDAWAPAYSLFFVSLGGGGNLVPRRDKGCFYILALVAGSKGRVVEGDQVYVCAYFSF